MASDQRPGRVNDLDPNVSRFSDLLQSARITFSILKLESASPTRLIQSDRIALEQIRLQWNRLIPSKSANSLVYP